MKKVLLSIMMAFSLTACGEKAETPKENEKPVVKIGATLPLSGGFAETGVLSQQAMQMALDKWKAKDTKYDYQLFVEDDVSELKKAVLNAQNFINTKKVQAIMTMFGIVDRPVDEIANNNKVISLSCSYGKTDVLEYAANNCVQNHRVAETLLPKLKKENIKKVALIMANTAVNRVVGDYFAERLPQEGFEVVAYEKYNMDTRDMRMSILAMEEKQPDYYLTFATPPLTDIFVKQLQETVGKRNVASFGSFPEMDPALFPLVENLWTIYSVAGTDEFAKEFENKTGSVLKSCNANSYDNMDMLIWAFENTPVKEGKVLPDTADVAAKLKSIKNWQGATGNVSFENGVISPKAELRMYQNGKWVKIEE